MYRTECINYDNVFCKQFDRNEQFSPFELRDGPLEKLWRGGGGGGGIFERQEFFFVMKFLV